MKHGSKQLIDWMGKRHFDQRRTAEYFGWNETFISKLVKRRRNPGLTNALLIEDKTGIPVEAWAVKTDSRVDEAEAVGATNSRKRK